MINPYSLTPEEIFEIADYNIRLWLDLKDNIRRYGVNSPKVLTGIRCFNQNNPCKKTGLTANISTNYFSGFLINRPGKCSEKRRSVSRLLVLFDH
jgi:hypothetical protein